MFTGINLQSSGWITINHLKVDNAACQINPDTNTNAAGPACAGAQFQRRHRCGETVQFARRIKARIRNGAA